MRKTMKKNAVKLLAASMVLSGIAVPGEVVRAENNGTEVVVTGTKGADAATTETSTTTLNWKDAPAFTFSDAAITASAEVNGVEINGTAIEISKAGTYVFNGTCADGSISVKKETEDVIIVLNGLDLTSATTAPICCKKKSQVEIYAVEGTENMLTDAKANEEEEKAVIKAKDECELTLTGKGTLKVQGNAKNGIKGSALADIVVKEQNLVITSLDNALASDNSLTIESGRVTINSEDGDGIKASPDEDDTESAGKIHLNGGEVIIQKANDGIQATDAITIKNGTYQIISADNAIKSDTKVQVDGGTFVLNTGGDGIKASNATGDTTEETSATTAGDIIIDAGDFTIDAIGDAIQAELALTIADGTYNLKTNGGSVTKLSNDADSCKALKAGTELTVNGGNYTIDSADDAVHSNEYVTINAGIFNIQTGDDGMHADTTLIVGQEAGEIQPTVQVTKSYEGLEGGTVYVFGGDIDVTSSDDGINAAGGSGNGTDPGNNGPGGDKFKPGGSRPEKRSNTATFAAGGGNTNGSSDYTIYMEGGNVKVTAGGDGLDSNGALNLNGGNIHVYGSISNGGNSPLDADGGINMNGGTVFAAGQSSMHEKMYLNQTTLFVTGKSYDKGTIINIVDEKSKVLFTEELDYKCNYIFYSCPDMTAEEEYSIVTGKLVEDEAKGDEEDITIEDEDPYVPEGDDDNENSNNPYEPKDDSSDEDVENTGGGSDNKDKNTNDGTDEDNKNADDDGTGEDDENTDDNDTGKDDENTDDNGTGKDDENTDDNGTDQDNENTNTGADDSNSKNNDTNTENGNIGNGSTTTQGGTTTDISTTTSGGTSAGESTIGTATVPGTPQVAVGTKLTDTESQTVYIVTDANVHTVAYAGTTNKKATKITIPETVTIDQITYTVTSIQSKALRNNKKITKVTIGSNVESIGKRAFEGCKKLKNIVIKTTKLDKGTVGSRAFKGTPKTATVKVPKGTYKTYKKWLVSKGISKKAKIKK